MSIKHMTTAWTQTVSSNQKLILLALCDNANDDGVCYPSLTTIQNKTGLSKPTIIKNIKDLEADQLILSHKRGRKRGGRYSTLYLVFPSENYENLDNEYKEKFSQSKEALPHSQSKEALPQEGIQSKEALPKPSLIYNRHLIKEKNKKENSLFNLEVFKKLTSEEKTLYMEYVAMRTSLKLKTTIKIHERLLKKYYNFGRNPQVIENAIQSNWRDFYQPHTKNSPAKNTFNISGINYSEDEAGF